ncbi:phage tail tip fiber protein, partial [Morganella morganii]|uniref:phage tail tip fiber protein n=2 Tax=Morganella morganii TaxID=582 RepID=UPI0034D41C96
ELKGGKVDTIMGFNAQQFAFYNPVNGKMDLFMYMKDGQIFMNEAFINKAWLNSVVVTDKMQSENYEPGKTGFLIDAKGGNAEFNSATFRGTLDVDSGGSTGRMVIKNNQIIVYDENGKLAVKIGYLGG